MEKVVSDILNNIIASVLKEVGFETTSLLALDGLREITKDYLVENLKIFNSNAQHAKRNFVNIFDILLSEEKGIIINNPLMTLVHEEYVEEYSWNSLLGNQGERIIHIYDFMPELPPTHTYRQTITRANNERLESVKIKTRVEQSVKSEKNMLKLFKSSNSLPKFVNYLHSKIKNKRMK